MCAATFGSSCSVFIRRAANEAAFQDRSRGRAGEERLINREEVLIDSAINIDKFPEIYGSMNRTIFGFPFCTRYSLWRTSGKLTVDIVLCQVTPFNVELFVIYK